MATAFASEKDERIADRENQWNEHREYFKEHIKPKVDEQRNKLEESISAEDKKEINRIREEIISQRLMQNDLFHEARASWIKGEEVEEGLIQELKAQRIVIENLHDKAKLIANKYRPEIDDMVADLRDELRSERADHREMRGDEWQGRGRRGEGPNGDARRNGPHGYSTGMQGDAPFGFGNQGPGRNRSMDVVRFLLWDVNRG